MNNISYKFDWIFSLSFAAVFSPFVIAFHDKAPWLVWVIIAIGAAVILLHEMIVSDVYTIPYNIRDKWYRIRNWFSPQQNWLIKKIPTHWVDKDQLWEICILEGIKHYVEKDGGLGWEEKDYENSQNDPTFPEWQKKFDKEVKTMYNYITVILPILEKELEEAWKKVPHFEFVNRKDEFDVAPNTYEKTYGEVDLKEKEIAILKTEIMVWAVTNRESIWS